jgi:hypothetical protein
MSAPSTQTAPPPAVPRDALRLVLFGMPAAGKSSLLGALAQAAQTQEHVLSGRLIDHSQGLTELQQRLYDEQPRRTVEEIVTYPIAFEPFAPEDRPPTGPRYDGLLIDCDGRVANDLLVRRKSLDSGSPEGTLAREVLQADTLVLVIDASAPPNQVDADFLEFGRFLRLLEKSRGQAAEVGGLPAFLVLTKCDLLARPTDSALDWVERIEERKRQVDRRFQDFLARKAAEEGPLAFGRVDLHLWATAVKRPALADAPAKPREPYGVAELFRQCLHSAADFRRRRRRAGRRLFWTVAGAAGLVALLLAVALTVMGKGGGPGQGVMRLQDSIAGFRSDEGQTTSQRLRGSPEQLARRAGVLRELKNDPSFGQLPQEQQDYVNDRLKELQEYEAYYRQLLAARPPTGARNLGELQDIDEALRTTLVPPREDWGETDAARLRDEQLKDVQALRAGVKEVEDWYLQMKEEGDALWTLSRRQPGSGGASVDWRAWQADVRKLLERADAPRFRETDRLRGLPSGPTWGQTVLRFEPVVEARTGWERTRQRLERLLNLSAALGLGVLPDRPPVLVISEGAALSPADYRTRVAELKKAYPKYEEEFRLTGLPEAALPDVRQAARANYDNLLKPAQALVLRRLQQAGTGDGETPARWQDVQRWLQAGPEELADWRVLATVLRRLHDPDASEPDPVAELATFLGRDRFELQLRRFSVRIPRDLGLRPQGNLTIEHTDGGKKELSLEPFGEPQYNPDTRQTTYTFRLSEGGALVYRPGEGITARLVVRKDGAAEPWALSWVRGRSQLYGFEHLSRGAFLHPSDRGPEASDKYDEGLRLIGGAETRIPAVPDLLPVVQLK